VLEIGVGCGYQTAVLSQLAAHVFGMEIAETLAKQATATLHRLGVANVTVRSGDGYFGWPEEAPFDAVLAACASDHVPPDWIDQLKPGGRVVLPMGDPMSGQDLWLLEKSRDSVSRRTILPVRFVPMTGEASNA
jgi:protein-L-isoaspartate(D-aspartate) O-methyltransferase